MPPASIRVGVSAAIVRAGQILLIEFDDRQSGLYFNFPGGQLHENEPLDQALARHIAQQTTALVTPGPLLHVWQYLPQHASQPFGPHHKLTFLLAATLLPDQNPQLPPQPNPNQSGVRWINLKDLHRFRLFPTPTPQLLNRLAQPPTTTLECETL